MIYEIANTIVKAPVAEILAYSFIIIGGVGSAYFYFSGKKTGEDMLREQMREKNKKKTLENDVATSYNTIDRLV